MNLLSVCCVVVVIFIPLHHENIQLFEDLLSFFSLMFVLFEHFLGFLFQIIFWISCCDLFNTTDIHYIIMQYCKSSYIFLTCSKICCHTAIHAVSQSKPIQITVLELFRCFTDHVTSSDSDHQHMHTGPTKGSWGCGNTSRNSKQFKIGRKWFYFVTS